MIKSLHKHLAALLILAISLALLGASGAALIVSERQLTLREQAAFLSRLDVIAKEVNIERSISNAQLAKTETTEHLLLSIYDNGQPILFQGGWQSITPRAALFDRATQAAQRAGLSLESAATGMRYTGDLRGDHGERYLAAVQTIGGYRSQRAVVMLQDMRAQDAQRAAQRWLFAGITLCAIAAMSVFGWLFTARAVKPITQAHAEQNAFVAAASHELKTPLQILQSNLDALKDSPADPRRFTSAMQRELNRMSRLSEDLTLLTNMEGETRALFGPVEMLDLAGEAVQDHQSAAAEKQIALKLIDPKSPLPLIEGDPLMLRRAINVLIDNAICYTQPGGHVTASFQTAPKHLALCVQDDGPGIAPPHQSRIFERFYRADQSRSDRSHSGLGLCIAKQIAVNHGGNLTYQPLKPHGSQFDMTLPLIQK